MEFLLTVRFLDKQEKSVGVEIDPEQKVCDLVFALNDFFQTGLDQIEGIVLLRTNKSLDFDESIKSAGLLSGDTVCANVTAPSRPPEVTESRTLDFIVGPEEGRYIGLPPGSEYDIGSSTGQGILVAGLMPRHFKISISDTLVAIVERLDGDLYINGSLAVGPCEVEQDDFIEAGDLGFAVRAYRKTEDRIDRLGQVEFHRTPYKQPIIRSREFDPLGPIPVTSAPNSFQFLAFFGPVAIGITMFLAMGRQPVYLLFVLMSPLLVVANYYGDKRRGKKSRTQERKDFGELVEKRVKDLHSASEAERRERWNAAPDAPDLLRRAEYRTPNMWPRGRSSMDFLDVRVGLCDLPSRIVSPLDRGGDDDLRKSALSKIEFVNEIRNVPFVLPFAELGAIALVGEQFDTRSVAASIIMQIAALHSPEDLVMMVGSCDALQKPPIQYFDLAGITKWLPHTYSLSSPIEGSHVCLTKDNFNELLGAIIAEADLRQVMDTASRRRKWPWMMVVIDNSIQANPTQVAQLLERCPEAGVSVLWLSTSRNDVPRQVTNIVDINHRKDNCDSIVWSTDPNSADKIVRVGAIDQQTFEKFVRAMAPLRDASEARAVAAIPRTAPLFAVLDVKEMSPQKVIDQWRTVSGYTLEHPIGLGVSGPLFVDLVEHGPHALIGGTSGSGKSELLQSISASLIYHYPPDRLNLLFVDYKGGAASKPFENVPHTVGCVTNLDEQLARRTIISLGAELRWRMELFKQLGGCKDLREVIRLHPEKAPPSLVIIVDEFATLVKEIPDFVDGIVDIAQRGRSLGLHLILATQRPSGAINENILTNTNLKISLRMLDRGESTAVIGAPDAADIPTPLRGRGLARLGPRELTTFQSAYSSAPVGGSAEQSSIAISDFTQGWTASYLQDGENVSTIDVKTQLTAVVEAVIEAAKQLKSPPPRLPWKEELPKSLYVDDIPYSAELIHPGREVFVGLVDDPDRQEQSAGKINIEESGGLLVFGSGGAGKTTLIRTVLSSLAMNCSPEDVHFVVFDFGSKSLQAVDAFPHVIGFAQGDDMEAVTRLISWIENEILVRRQVLAENLSETLSAYNLGPQKLPRIVVVIDNYQGFASLFSGLSSFSLGEVWLERMSRIVIDGRSVGIHAIITADRHNGVPSALHAAVAARIVLRQMDEKAYSHYGIGAAQARSVVKVQGRGFWVDDKVFQCACVSSETSSAGQATKLRENALKRTEIYKRLIRSEPLANEVYPKYSTNNVEKMLFSVGTTDVTEVDKLIDLSREHCLVVGDPGSGRSNLLRFMVEQASSRYECAVIGTSKSPLVSVGCSRSSFGGSEAVMTLLREIVADASGSDTLFLFIDDLDSFGDSESDVVWSQLAKKENLRVFAAIESNIVGHGGNHLLRELRRSRHLILVQPENYNELSLPPGKRINVRPGVKFPVGRAVVLSGKSSVVVQVPLLSTKVGQNDLYRGSR